MLVLAVGLSHKSAPVAVRERLAFREEELPDALQALRDYVSEGAILSTCNRTEVYALVGHRDRGARNLRRFLGDWHGLEVDDLPEGLYECWQDEAVRHVFRVAAGLDSMVLGEPQILGQVKDAYQAAIDGNSLGPVLSRLLRHAVEAGKRARTETAISRNSVTVSYAAVELLQQALGDLRQARMLVVGAGEMGKLSTVAMLRHGARHVVVTSRSPERAAQVAETVRATPVPFSSLADELARADILLTCTSASDYVITPDIVERATTSRQDRPLYIVDIAVPRDVDPAVKGLPSVQLYNVDDLEAVCTANLRLRYEEAAKVERILDQEVGRFMQWWDGLDVVPTIAALVDKAEAMRQAELARAMPRLASLSDEQKQTVQALTSAIVSKMLHHPIVRLKDNSGERDGRNFIPAVRELFELEESRPG